MDNTESSSSLKDELSDSEGKPISRQPSETSIYGTEDDEEVGHIQLGPKCTIKEHLEKDKDDESLRKWKEQLLGGVDVTAIEEAQEPDVKIISLTIQSEGRSDMVLPIPASENPKGMWFTLKEGSHYRLRFSIKVSNDIVCGLRYINTVWKSGIKVDSSKQMLGTFSPQAEPYTHQLEEETTPSGVFARGTYSARTKIGAEDLLWLHHFKSSDAFSFIDDDKKCYLEINYSFDIQKDWAK